MPSYRRTWVPGGAYFFTATLHDRRSNLLTREIDLLRRVIAQTRRRYPFRIDAWVVLPECMRCLRILPPDDADFVTRWKVIKSGLVRRTPCHGSRTLAQRRRGQRAIWQQRYWEHLIRNDTDYRRHLGYVHFNPVRHGLVTVVKDWPFFTFHQAVAEGLYPEDWAGDPPLEVRAAERV